MAGRLLHAVLISACAVLWAGGCAGRAPARQPAPAPDSASASATTPGTARAAPLALDTVLALNPAMAGNGYALRPGPEPGLSVWAPTGAGHVELVVNAARTVVGVRGVFPTSTGLQPWYDQSGGMVSGALAGGAAPAAPGSSTAPYSVSNSVQPNNTSSPAAGTPNQAGPVGPGAAAGDNARGAASGTVYTETLWLVSRSQAATGPAALPQFTALAELNPAMSRARAQTRFLPGAGVLYGPRSYGMLAMVDRSGRLVGLLGWFPLGAGWQPFYDQLPGHEDIVPQFFLKGFTQHVWLVPPAAIR